MIDVFTKCLTVIPLEKNKIQAIGDGILKSFQLQGKQPDILYSDSEGSLFSKEFFEWDICLDDDDDDVDATLVDWNLVLNELTVCFFILGIDTAVGKHFYLKII